MWRIPVPRPRDEPVTFPSTVRRTGRTSQLQQTEKAVLSGPPSVENTGVEPVTSCMPCKRSSQLS